MRTDQFLEGYDSLRRTLQAKLNDLLKAGKLTDDFSEIVKLASFPYYERDGQDWKPGEEPIGFTDW